MNASDKYLNKYRIPSARHQNWDYGWDAAYFVTICTRHIEHYFGEAKNEQMQLSEIGELAQKFWEEIPLHFPFVSLDVFVVMPNHVHGIIVLNNPDKDDNTGHSFAGRSTVETGQCPCLYNVSIRSFSTSYTRLITVPESWERCTVDNYRIL